MGTLLVWVLYLAMPGSLPDVPIGGPVLTLEECYQKGSLVEAPFPMICLPKHLDWEDLT